MEIGPDFCVSCMRLWYKCGSFSLTDSELNTRPILNCYDIQIQHDPRVIHACYSYDTHCVCVVSAGRVVSPGTNCSEIASGLRTIIVNMKSRFKITVNCDTVN